MDLFGKTFIFNKNLKFLCFFNFSKSVYSYQITYNFCLQKNWSQKFCKNIPSMKKHIFENLKSTDYFIIAIWYKLWQRLQWELFSSCKSHVAVIYFQNELDWKHCPNHRSCLAVPKLSSNLNFLLKLHYWPTMGIPLISEWNINAYSNATNQSQ